ncbi:skin secretory protein xP2 [Drosophila montana]|uniref:skin secretory protein xP2 n=1 Tax=Drosophila montana TaxID=40370 RepID=UPI00313D8493
MKHIIIAIIAVLSVLHRDQLLATAKGCPRRYLRRINGKCYYFSVKKMNWFGALNNCLRKGLTLADLSDARDFYGAVEFLSSKGNTEDFWFGANDLQTEGRFQYISNGRLVRYYSNYSIVEPAEHSECDDCLEVRIRNNLTVVADDNCLERQYFICSERYCDVAVSKPRHHSHEHLHHFHHDIGEASDAEGEMELNNASPENIEEQQADKNESEEAANPETPVNNGDEGEMTTERGEDTTPTAEEGETPAAGGDDAAPPAEGGETPAEGGETPAEGAEGAAPPAEEGETPAEGAEGAAPPAEGGEAAPAEGAAPPAEGGEAAPAEGAAPPAEGGEAAPAEGAAPPAEGGEAAPAEGAAPPAEGGEAPAEAAAAPAEGGEAAPAEGASPPAEGGEATPAEGAAPPAEGGEAAPAEGEAPPAEGGEAAPAEGEAPPAEGGEAPAEAAAPPAEGGEAAPAEGEAPPAK